MIRKLQFIAAIVLLFLVNQGIQPKAYTISMTTKEFLNFEILEASINNNALTITGWAFLNENQHFRNASDHAIQLEFIGISDSFIVNTTLNNLSMTSAYEQVGIGFCAKGVYKATNCNYYLEYVGFSVTIPISQFKQGVKYITNVIVLAYNSQTYLKTPLYYPISTPFTSKIGDYAYSITSQLKDTQLRIIETPVYARKGPGKTSTIWTSGVNCSLSYGNKLYFKFDTVYSNVISRIVMDNQTFYELSAKTDICVDMRRRIVEGTIIFPVWISGMFVEYSGTPMQISSELVNMSPIITAENQSIYVNHNVNLLDYAKSHDLEDGDISNKTIIEYSDFVNRVGIYHVTYYVEDKYGYFDRKSIEITVLSPLNDPPVINANDKAVLQYSKFDYFADVNATDAQDGDLTKMLIVLNQVDTSLLGNQDLCYSVTDSLQITTIKCIIVNVYSLGLSSSFRYISKNNLL